MESNLPLNLVAGQSLRLCAEDILLGPAATLSARRLNPGARVSSSAFLQAHRNLQSVLHQVVVATYRRGKKRPKTVSKVAFCAGLLGSDAGASPPTINAAAANPGSSGWSQRPPRRHLTAQQWMTDLEIHFLCIVARACVTPSHLNSIRQIKFHTTLFPSAAWAPSLERRRGPPGGSPGRPTNVC